MNTRTANQLRRTYVYHKDTQHGPFIFATYVGTGEELIGAEIVGPSHLEMKDHQQSTDEYGNPLTILRMKDGQFHVAKGYFNVSPDDLTFKDVPDRGDLTDIDITPILDIIAK
jgi:hypothetical protein